jgi:uracil-DNA glycosylase family 4
LVLPTGPEKAKLLIIGEYPGVEEIKTGRPWVGAAGEVLTRELERAGLNRDYIRITNLWQHRPPTKPRATPPKALAARDKWNEERVAYVAEFTFHYNQMLKELRGRKGILLMGSDVTEALLGQQVSHVAGCNVKSDMLPNGYKVAMAIMNPAVVFRTGPDGTLGETRSGIERFAKACREADLA